MPYQHNQAAHYLMPVPFAQVFNFFRDMVQIGLFYAASPQQFRIADGPLVKSRYKAAVSSRAMPLL
jgi:hypothetical protein